MASDLMVEKVLDAVKDVARSGKLSSSLTTFLLGQDVGFDGWSARMDMLRGMIRSAIDAAAPTWTVVTITPPSSYGVAAAMDDKKPSEAKLAKFARQIQAWYGNTSPAAIRSTPHYETKQVQALTEDEAVRMGAKLWQYRESREEIIEDGARLAGDLLMNADRVTAERAMRRQLFDIRDIAGSTLVGNLTDAIKVAAARYPRVADLLAKLSAAPVLYVNGVQVYDTEARKAIAEEAKNSSDLRPIDEDTAIAKLRLGAKLGRQAPIWNPGLVAAAAAGALLSLSRTTRPPLRRYGAHALWATAHVTVDIFERDRMPFELIWYEASEPKIHMVLEENYSYDAELFTDIRRRLRDADFPDYYAWVFAAGPTTSREADEFVPDVDYMSADGSRKIGVTARVPMRAMTDYWNVTGGSANLRADGVKDLRAGLIALERGLPNLYGAPVQRSPRLMSALNTEPLPEAAAEIEMRLKDAQAAEDTPSEDAKIQALRAALDLDPHSRVSRAIQSMRYKATGATMTARLDDLAKRAIGHFEQRIRVLSDRSNAERARVQASVLTVAKPLLDALNLWHEQKSEGGRKLDPMSHGVAIYPIADLSDGQRAILRDYGVDTRGTTHVGIGTDGHRAYVEATSYPPGTIDAPVWFKRTSPKGEWTFRGRPDPEWTPHLSLLDLLHRDPEARSIALIADPTSDTTRVRGALLNSGYVKAAAKFLGGKATRSAGGETKTYDNGVVGRTLVALANGNRIAAIMPIRDEDEGVP